MFVGPIESEVKEKPYVMWVSCVCVDIYIYVYIYMYRYRYRERERERLLGSENDESEKVIICSRFCKVARDREKRYIY